MATKQELLAEAYRRGLLPPEKKAAYEEARRRGLLGGEAAAPKGKPTGLLEGMGRRLESSVGNILGAFEALPGMSSLAEAQYNAAVSQNPEAQGKPEAYIRPGQVRAETPAMVREQRAIGDSVVPYTDPNDISLGKLLTQPQKALPAIGEQALYSLPSMLPFLAGPQVGTAVTAMDLTGDVAYSRADANKTERPTGIDWAVAAPVGAASAALEKIGASKVLGPIAGGAAARALREVPREMLRAGATEALTEAGQEALQYAGSTAGTATPFSAADMLRQAEQGALVGGGMGAGVRGVTAPIEVGANRLASGAPAPTPEAQPAPETSPAPDVPLSPFEQAVVEVQARTNIPREDAEAMVRMTMPEPEQVEDVAGTDAGGLGAGVPSTDGGPVGGQPAGQPADAGLGDVGAAGPVDGAPVQRAEPVEPALTPPSMTDEEMLDAFEARDQEQEILGAEVTPPAPAVGAEIAPTSPELTPQLPPVARVEARKAVLRFATDNDLTLSPPVVKRAVTAFVANPTADLATIIDTAKSGGKQKPTLEVPAPVEELVTKPDELALEPTALAPAPEGMVRLYRGETATPDTQSDIPEWVVESPEYQATRQATGRWFTESVDEARHYNTVHGDGTGKISYVDVPENELESYRVTNNPEAKKFSGRPEEEFFLPPDLAGARKELKNSTPEPTAPAPAPEPTIKEIPDTPYAPAWRALQVYKAAGAPAEAVEQLKGQIEGYDKLKGEGKTPVMTPDMFARHIAKRTGKLTAGTKPAAEEFKNIVPPPLVGVEGAEEVVREATKVPSLSRKVDKLVRQYDGGLISDKELAERVSYHSRAVERARFDKRDRQAATPRARGADYIRQRLLEAKRRGDISEEGADLAEWFIQRNPALVDDLGISMRRGTDRATAGSYNPTARIMTLIKETGSTATGVHEIMHHLERMLPGDVQTGIRTSWLKALTRAERAERGTPNPFMVEFFRAARAGDTAKASELVADGKVGYRFYQYVNPSEFWAVNASRIMQGEFDVRGSTLGKLRKWLSDFAARIQQALGLPSDYPLLRALRSLAASDGRFVSDQMLAGKGAREYRMYIGADAASRHEGLERYLRKAEAMEKAGRTTGTKGRTRAETGWFRNPHDKKWRFELSDHNATLKLDPKELTEVGYVTVGDLLDHPDLYSLYPELASVPVRLDPPGGYLGYYSEEANEIGLKADIEDPLKTLLHEVQHYVQGREDFARGANTSTAYTKLNKAQRERLLEEARAKNAMQVARMTRGSKAAEKVLRHPRLPEYMQLVKERKRASDDEATSYETIVSLRERVEELANAIYTESTGSGMPTGWENTAEDDVALALKNGKTERLREIMRRRFNSYLLDQRDKLRDADLTDRSMGLASGIIGNKFDIYEANPGEGEARDTAERSEMDPYARLDTAPYSGIKDYETHPYAAVHYGKGPVGSIATPSQKAAKKSQEKLTRAAKKVANAAATAGALGYDNSATAKELIDAFSGNIKARDAGAIVDDAAAQPLSGWPVPVLNALVPQIPSAEIVRWAKTEGLELDPAYRLLTEMTGYHGRLQRASTRLGEDFNGWIGKNGSDVMSATMHYARLAGLTFSSVGDRATALQTDPELVKLRAELANAAPDKQSAAKAQVTLREKDIRKGYDLWDALGQKKGGHEMYRRVHQFYADMYDLSRALIKQRIENMGLKPKDEAKLWQTVRLEMEQARDEGDYFPLMRNGKYYVYYKASPVGRIFETFDTAGDRDKAIARYQKDFGIQPDGQGSNVNEMRNELTNESAMLRTMLDAVRKQAGGSLDVENLLDDTYQMFLQFLPERSLRKQFIHTKNGGVAGFSSDVARNFANMAGRYASQLPKLKYAHKVQAELDRAEAATKGMPSDTRERLDIFSGEVRRRAEQEFNPEEPNAALSVLNRATATFLLSGGATALAQTIAIPQRVLPHLTRYYGFGPTNRMALKYMQFWKMVGVNFGDFGRQGFGPSIGDSAYIKNNPVLKEIFDAGQDQFGLFESNASHYLDTAPSPTTPTGGLRGFTRDITRAPVSTVVDATKRVADVTSRALMWTFSVSERLVNQQTFMMAAELELAKSGDKEKAKEAGVRAITDAIGRYQRYERPQIMRGTLGPTLTMFKMYPVHTTSFFIRNAATVAKEMSGGDPKAARAAALEMGYVLAMTGVFAGAVGMPLYSTITMVTDLVIKAMDDEEEEAERLAEDPFYGASSDLRFRYRILPDLFGDNSVELGGRKIPLSDVVRDGLVPTLTDAGIGSRASLDGIWFRPGQGDSTPSIILNTIAANLPGASFVTNFGRGYDLINQGEVEKGLEAMLPAGARNLLRATRFSEEGITTNRGDPILEPDEFTDANFLAQVLGLPVQRIAGRMDAGRKVKARSVQLGKDRQALLRRFNKLGRDPQVTDEQLDKLGADMRQFNATVSGVPKLLIDADALNRSWKSFEGRPVADGYVLDPRLGPYELEVLRDASSPE